MPPAAASASASATAAPPDAYDLIVVGAGSAGLPAAIRAAERGLRVLQIEADGRIGGTLHWSSGQISAAGTSLQRAKGIEDSPQEHYEDAQRIARDTIDPDLGQLFCGQAAATFEWLTGLGYRVAALCPTAFEYHEAYRTARYMWGEKAGLSILEVLAPAHERLVAAGKIDLRLKTRMTGLLGGPDAVTGVMAEGPDGAVLQFTAPQTLLTTGGYAANPTLWAELQKGLPLCAKCNPFSRGDGLQAARALGAAHDRQDLFLPSFAGVLDDPADPFSANFLTLVPRVRPPWEIFLDASGKRFLREDHPSIDARERALLHQPQNRMVILFDEAIRQSAPPMTADDRGRWHAKFGRLPNFLKAETLEGLAGPLGFDPATLAQTVARYNQAVDQGHDPDFGREVLLRRIEKGPFYAIKAQGITVVSPGGLKVNSALQVLRGDGQVINGLYAAGEVLGFARLSGNAFVGGMSLMPALTFGRLLGESLPALAKAA